MITLDQNIRPKELNLTGNPILAKLHGDRMWAVNGSKFSMMIVFPEYPDVTYAADTWLQWVWGNNTLRVTFKAPTLVDDSGTQFKTAVPIGFAWVSEFASFLRSNYLFDKYFEISVDENYFSIHAREKGTESNITFTKHSGLTTTSYYSTNGADPVMQDGYQLFLQLRNDDDEVIGEESVTPANDQSATFDLAEYLESELEQQREADGLQFTYPSGEDLVITRSAFMIEFAIRYAEKWNGNVRKLAETDGFWALLGGLSKAKLAELEAVGIGFYDLVTESQLPTDVPRFLTFSPKSKTTGENTPERLYFYKNPEYESYVKRREYYSDGSDVEYIHAEIPYASDVYEIICSANTLAIPGTTLVKFDIYVVDNDDNVMSDIKTFVVDHTYYRNEHYFIFRNSLGGYDTLRCTGVLKYKPEFERETFTNDDDETSTVQVLMEQVYEANTGSLTSDMALWMNDFMLSKEVYWLRENVAHKIVVTSKKKTVISDTDRRFNIEFEFSLAAKDKYHSTPEIGTGFNINQPATGGEIPISG